MVPLRMSRRMWLASSDWWALNSEIGAQLPRLAGLLRLLAGHDGPPDGDGRRGRRDHGREDRQAGAAVAQEHVLNPRRPRAYR